MDNATYQETGTAGLLPFGDLVHRYRRMAGLTQEELAERAGLSERAIREIERGTKHTPRKDTVQLLADALELDGSEREAFQQAARRVRESDPCSPRPRLGASSELHAILIADIRGYTRFTQEQGDEAAAQLAARFAEVVEEEVSRHGGQLLELRGDEAMVVFSSAREAIRAAVNLQLRFAREREAHPELPLQVGIGLDTGDVVPIQGGYRGGALNLAARLCSLAGAGEVFAGEALVHLARKTSGYVSIDRGVVHLKGLSDPVRVIQIAAEGEVLPDLPPLEQVLVSHPTNLPDEPTPFIGREREITEVAELLGQPGVRLVTLTGTGGTGKTRLALQVAGQLLPQFEEGIFVVSLAPLSDPRVVPSAIAEAVGVKEHGSTSLVDALTGHLRSKHPLLVLDNFEHLLDAAPLVGELLESCRTLHILVTSRIPLHLAREHEYCVPPLSIPDGEHLPPLEELSQYEAVALFIERARAAQASFALTNDHASAVAEICARLDGLPLAIVLAAARIKLFPPRALLQRLSSRLTLLTGGARDGPARQQTLRNTLDWSYSLLSAGEQELFARLSVFAGGCTFEAAEAVCNPEGDLEIDVVDGVASLVDQSLLRQVGEERARYSMLQTVRDYARERLQEHGEQEDVKAAHAEYFLALAEEAESELAGRRQRAWFARLDDDLDNVRLALGWFHDHGAVEKELRLASALFRGWYPRGLTGEARRWLEAALSVKVGASWSARAKALWSLGYFASLQGDGQEATGLLEEALGLYRSLGDRAGTARVVEGLGLVAMWAGQYERATAYFDEGLRLARELNDQRAEAWNLFTLGAVAGLQGDFVTAKQRYEDSLTVSRAAEDTFNIAFTLTLQGQVALDEGNPAEGERLCEESLALARGAGITRVAAYALRHLARIDLRTGQLERASQRVRESLVLGREQGERLVVLYDLGTIAALAGARGNALAAARLKGAEMALRERLGIPVPPVYVQEGQEVVAQAKAMLDEEDFARAWEAGQAMSLDEAIAYALAESE